MSEDTHIDIALEDGATTKIAQFGQIKNDTQPIFICLSAMGVAGSYYKPLAIQLSEQGAVAFTTDYRGIGHSSVLPKQNDFGYKEIVDYDYRGIFTTIIDRYPNNPKYLLGHSLGGQLGSLYLSRFKAPSVKGVILIASCSVYYKGWDGIAAYLTLLGTQSCMLISQVLGYFPGKVLGFGGTEAKSVMRDWSRQARTGAYRPANTDFDYEAALQELKLPSLVISIQGDQYAPKKAITHLYKKFHPAAPIHHHHLTPDEAGIPNLNHFNWVRQPQGISVIIQEWLNQQL